MTNLTPKQEKYCQSIVSGKSQYEAYLDAYNVSPDTKRETTDNDAYKQSLKPEIVARIIFLREPVVKKAQRTLQDILNDISDVRERNNKDDDKLVLDCLKHEAKLLGFEVIRTDLTSKGKSMAIVPAVSENWGQDE